MIKFILWATALLSLCATTSQAKGLPRDPELEAAFLGKLLKPILDEDWRRVTGRNTSDPYKVLRGDTLYDVSHKLFGRPGFWPKIWALNNLIVTNPHRITPNLLLAFSLEAGQSTDSPRFALLRPDPWSHRSQEWRGLPRQRWEADHQELPSNVDALGFDIRSKIAMRGPTGFDLQAIAASEEIKILGEIKASRIPARNIGLRDTVYIEADEPIEIGKVYGITDEPVQLTSPRTGRKVYSYANLGKVKIKAVKDHLFIGTLLSVHGLIPRKSLIIPLPERVPYLTPMPGPARIRGVVLIDPRFSTKTAAQRKEVIVDRGTNDGIKPGMIFRAYRYVDPSNDKTITRADFIVDADIMVSSVSEKFCTGNIIQGNTTIVEHAPVVLLTNLTNLKFGESYYDQEDKDEDLSEVNAIADDDDLLAKKDKQEIKQLEDWKTNPEEVPPEDTGEETGKENSSDQATDSKFDTDLEDEPAQEPTPTQVTPPTAPAASTQTPAPTEDSDLEESAL